MMNIFIIITVYNMNGFHYGYPSKKTQDPSDRPHHSPDFFPIFIHSTGRALFSSMIAATSLSVDDIFQVTRHRREYPVGGKGRFE